MGLIGQFCVHENAWNLKKRALVAGEVSLKRTRAVCEAVHLTGSECFHSFWTFVPQGKVFEASPAHFPTGQGRRPALPPQRPPAPEALSEPPALRPDRDALGPFLCALRTPFCPSQRTAPARTRLGDRRARGETALSSLSSLEPAERAVWAVPVAAAPPETLPGRARQASAPADDAAGETGPRDSTQTVLETNPHQLPFPFTKGSTEPESLALPKRPRRKHGTTANARSRQPT